MTPIRNFWHDADAIIRSTRLPHDLGLDAAREALAAEARERRHFEIMSETPTPAPALIEISS